MNGLEDKKVVLVLGVVSVLERVSVSKDGKVKGLLNKKFTEDSELILL